MGHAVGLSVESIGLIMICFIAVFHSFIVCIQNNALLTNVDGLLGITSIGTYLDVSVRLAASSIHCFDSNLCSVAVANSIDQFTYSMQSCQVELLRSLSPIGSHIHSTMWPYPRF